MHPSMPPDIEAYHQKLSNEDQKIAGILYTLISEGLPEANCKIWHAHPVWFLNENPIVGYHRLKEAIRILFWSGQSFDESLLKKEGSFMAAEMRFREAKDIPEQDLIRILGKARTIQWDYKNLIRRKGKLERLS